MSWISNIVDTVRKVIETAQRAKLQQDIAAAQGAVKTATQNYRNNSTNDNKKVLVDTINNYLTLVAYDLRKVAVADPSAIDAEIARLKAEYPGTQREKDVLFPLLDDLGTQIKGETPAQRQLQVEVYDAQALVGTTRSDLNAAQTKLDGLGTGPAYTSRMADDRIAAQNDLLAKQAAFGSAVSDLIGLEIDLELTYLKPAGPNGTYTPEQYQQAADKVKARYGATAESATAIDQVAMVKSGGQDVQFWLDKLKTDPNSFTAAERKLAETDPISFAFIKALGVKLDPESLTGEMRTLAEKDPVLYAILQSKGVKIWTSADKPPVDIDSAPLKDGKYLYITIGNSTKPIPVTPQMAQQYDLNGPQSVGPMLMPQLGLDKDPAFARLAAGADHLRAEYVDTQMKALMAAGKTEEAVKMLGINMPQFFSLENREAVWETSARPLLEPVFKDGLDQIKFDENGMDPFLSKIGQYMNQHLNGAPPEVASLMLDLAMGRVDVLGKEAFDAGQPPMGGNNSILYGAFSNAVQLADQLPGSGPTPQGPGVNATKVADWMVNYEWFSLVNMNSPGIVANDIAATGNYYLADALALGLNAREGDYVDNFAKDFTQMVVQAEQQYGDKLLEGIYEQAYLEFMKNPDQILKPFFDEFLGDTNIGQPVRITSDTMLRNMIGKTMGLTPTNKQAYKDRDYTQEWYSPGTVEWNIITSISDGIKDQGGSDPLVNALPAKLVAANQGVKDGGIFIITKANGEQVVIDGMMIMASVLGAGGEYVDTDGMNATWHYTDFRKFQEDSFYSDDTTLFVPKDLRLQDVDSDGHADYSGEDISITTAKEHAQMGLSLLGVGLMFVPGAQGLGVALLAGGVLLSVDRLATMHGEGANVGWSNPMARSEWMNIIGSGLVFVRIGTITGMTKFTTQGSIPFKFLNGTQKVLGGGAGYVGLTQMLGQTQYLIQNWKYMDWGDRAHSFVLIGAGALQMGMGSRNLQPFKWGPSRKPVTTQGSLRDLIQQRAYRIWEQAGRPEGQADVHWQQAWQSVKDEAVGTRAYQIWEDAGKPQGQADAHWAQASQEFQAKIGNHAYGLWEGAGKPHGQDKAHWDAAEYAVYQNTLLPATTAMPSIPRHAWNTVRGTFGTARANLGVKGQSLADAWRGRATYGTRWEQFRAQGGAMFGKFPKPTVSIRNLGTSVKSFGTFSKSVITNVGRTYLWVNGAGLVGSLVYNFGFQESRLDSAPKLDTNNVDAQMKEFLANPDAYLEKYYDESFFGIAHGDMPLFNFNGHLLSYTAPDGTQVFCRRVPADLYAKYVEVHGTNSEGRVFLPEETIKLGGYPGFTPNVKIDPQYYADADANYGGDIGRSAYAEWIQAGRPDSIVTAEYWTGLEDTFYRTKTGSDGYQYWSTHGRPTTGTNDIWGQALKFYEDDISATATLIWTQGGRLGTGPTQAQFEQAQDRHAEKIGMKAYELWVDGGKKPGVVTTQFWTDAKTQFDKDVGQPAFDMWMQAGKPDNLGNEIWTLTREDQVGALWQKDGSPIKIQVELRAPWRENPTQDMFLGDADDGTGPTGRFRGSLGFGPVEGWRPHADVEGVFMYPYNLPTTTTVRAGLPSPTQGLGIGIRQQDTTIWNRARLAAGSLDFNRFQIYDLTTMGAGSELDIMDGRFYLDVGNRNRIRLDYGGGVAYARIRETGFVEFGLGIDFLKYAYGDTSHSFNGYYELQFYGPDLRAQVNLIGGDPDKSYTRGFQNFPMFEIDPALQFSTTDERIPRILDVPVLSGEER